MKHTPGPWRACKGSSNSGAEGVWGTVREPARDYNLVDVIADVDELKGCAEANARLIAAAPELLKACRDLISTLKLYATNGDVSGLLSVQDAERAIRKAEEGA